MKARGRSSTAALARYAVHVAAEPPARRDGAAA